MKNKITDVRDMTIEAMQRLMDPEEGDTFDVKKAKAVAELAKVAVESAKVEVMFMRTAEKLGYTPVGTGFIGSIEPQKQL